MNEGTRDFSESLYSVLNSKTATSRLIADGYRQISNTFRTIARVDITEDQLKTFFREKYFWPVTFRYDSDPGGWQDHYRRGYTKDIITNVPDEIMKMMRELIDYRVNCFERRTQMLRLKDLAVDETFKHPDGIHVFQVTEERDEACGNIRIFCKNLTSGNNYFQGGHREVIRVSNPGTDKGKRFWMCYVEGRGAPTFKHYTLQEAQTEAERLARSTGSTVFVLLASRFVIPNRLIPPLSWYCTNG